MNNPEKSHYSSRNHLNSLVCLAGAVATLLAASPIRADQTSSRVGIGATASTLGAGAEVSFRFADDYLALRAGINKHSYETVEEIDDLDVDINFQFDSYTAMLDWSPFGGKFHLTGGLVSNGNIVTLTAEETDRYELGNGSYDLGEVGQLTGRVGFEEAAPYAGLGWDFPVGQHASVSFEIGAMFQGAAQIQLSASGLISGDPDFQRNLDQEAQELEDDWSEFEIYPVVKIGFHLRF